MVVNGMNADQIRKVFGVKNHPHSITISTDGPTEFILPSIEKYRYLHFLYTTKLTHFCNQNVYFFTQQYAAKMFIILGNFTKYICGVRFRIDFR